MAVFHQIPSSTLAGDIGRRMPQDWEVMHLSAEDVVTRQTTPDARLADIALLNGYTLVCNKKSRDGSGKGNLSQKAIPSLGEWFMK